MPEAVDWRGGNRCRRELSAHPVCCIRESAIGLHVRAPWCLMGVAHRFAGASQDHTTNHWGDMDMHPTKRKLITALAVATGAAVLGSCAALKAKESGQQVILYGSNEVPPAATSAYGTGTVNIMADRRVVATVNAIYMTATAAHIHEGAAGANGPVIVPFTRISDNVFVALDGAKLTDAQYASYKAGNLYVNVHSARYPGGEVRAQLVGR
jgi:hypothetical protein